MNMTATINFRRKPVTTTLDDIKEWEEFTRNGKHYIKIVDLLNYNVFCKTDNLYKWINPKTPISENVKQNIKFNELKAGDYFAFDMGGRENDIHFVKEVNHSNQHILSCVINNKFNKPMDYSNNYYHNDPVYLLEPYFD